ncbi:MBL fold metallo-hydrolase [Metalysinibacillus jejuensis]|uniref:MBL fold metallo-hydrolase n=1 Tax=Metalysinibacillus jejuensis TaxID=914327 RepID=UPI000D36870C|nr:MBL fold metallo-hydrolase [Metalysinibacillus jejuensis]
MKNLFLNRSNLNKDTIILKIKLKQLDLNMLFIKQGCFILGYSIDTVTYTEPNSTEIKLKSIVPIKVGKDFLNHLYSDVQLKKNTNNADGLAATASLNSTTKYSFPFAYATIDFTQATQKKYLPILNAYTENLLLKQSTDKQTMLTPFDYKDNMPDKINDGVTTYAKVIQVDDEYHLTLTNDKMWHLDYLYASPYTDQLEENLKKLVDSYKPYFYEFIPDDPLAFEDAYTDEDIYYIVEFNNKKNAIPGTVEFSASAFQYLSTAIQLKNTLHSDNKTALQRAIEDKISPFTHKDCESKEKATGALNSIIGSNSINNFGVTLFDVGNANAIQLSINNKAKAIIDFGFSNQKDNQSEIDAFMKHIEDIDLILLTHWDLDHIKGISQFELPHYHKHWIVPEPKITKVSHSALRLICYLVKKIQTDNLIIVPQKNNRKIIATTSYFTLGKGSGRGTGGSVHRNDTKWLTRYNDLNNLGLVLSLSTKEGESILFSGDCEYSEFPEDMQIHYTHLIAAHHGAKVDGIALPEDTTANKNVYFCAKMDNKYPHRDHISLLKSYGYTLNTTKKIILNK